MRSYGHRRTRSLALLKRARLRSGVSRGGSSRGDARGNDAPLRARGAPREHASRASDARESVWAEIVSNAESDPLGCRESVTVRDDPPRRARALHAICASATPRKLPVSARGADRLLVSRSTQQRHPRAAPSRPALLRCPSPVAPRTRATARPPSLGRHDRRAVRSVTRRPTLARPCWSRRAANCDESWVGGA